jgi:hypothetical protein
MRKAISMVILAVASGNAAASWVAVAGNEKLTAYADRGTISKAGNTVTMWTLLDYVEIQPFAGIGTGPFLSSQSQVEFDCKGERSRTLFLSNRASHMGEGNVVLTVSDPESTWTPVPPGTMVEKVWKIACGKK